MLHIHKMMTPEEYEKEYRSGLHQTFYNHCRFAKDKTEYARRWIIDNVPNVNIDNPITLVDRICWCKVYDMNPAKALWADKINAYHEIASRFPELVIEPTLYSRGPLLDGDFALLPDGKYILRMNHGSGWNIVFEKTPNFDPSYLQQKVWEWYNLNFAYIVGYEWQYENIIPGFIIQPYLGDLMNWEFWCEDGNILSVNIQKKIGRNLEENIAWFDEYGNKPKWVIGDPYRLRAAGEYEKTMLAKMVPYVKSLAKDFKIVRVDLYGINNEVKFGELTFTPCSGRIKIKEI